MGLLTKERNWTMGGGSSHAVWIIGLLLVVAGGCGDESSSSPTVEDPQIACESVDDMSYDAVSEVSIAVSDADRDLQIPSEGLRGQLDGIDIRLKDPNADRRFTWSPPSGMGETPFACTGTFTLEVTARDQAGNVTNFEASVSPGNSEQ